MKPPGSGIIVPEPLAVAGIAMADTSVCGVPLSTVGEGPWHDHAQPMVTDWSYEYYCLPPTYSKPEWARLSVTIPWACGELPLGSGLL